MGPIGHTAISLGIGAGAWAATGEPLAVPVAVAAGVLIDSDHVPEYLHWFVSKERRYMIVPFHAWEYALIGLVTLALFWNHPLFFAALLGHLGHLFTDQLANHTRPMAYSIIYRIYRRFDYDSLVSADETHGDDIPIWGQIEPLLWKLALMRQNRQTKRAVIEQPQTFAEEPVAVERD